MSRPWFEPTAFCIAGEHSSKELLQQLMLLLFGTSTILYFVAGDLKNDYIDKKRKESTQHFFSPLRFC
jgi:hypothetical protein